MEVAPLDDAPPQCRLEAVATRLKQFHGKRRQIARRPPEAVDDTCKLTAHFADLEGRLVSVSCLRQIGGTITQPQTDTSRLLPCVKMAVSIAISEGLVHPAPAEDQLSLDFTTDIL